MEVVGNNLPEAYHKALHYLATNGVYCDCPDYDQEILECSMTMVVNKADEEPFISKIFPGGHHELQQYTMEICDGILDFMIGAAENVWEYTYHQRMIKDDQLNFVINDLRRNPYSRRAVIDIRDNSIDQNNTHPACLQHIQFMIRNNKLDMYVTMRSNDAFEATYMNAVGFIFLQKKIAKELGVEVGKYEHRANSFHVYSKNYKQFFSAVEKINTCSFDDLVYEYEDFYKELMEDEIPSIMNMVKCQKDKYNVS